MSFFSLPEITFQNNILHPKPSKEQYIINQSLKHYLETIKKNIDSNPDEWDKYKKYTNPYEFIHTCVPVIKKSISTLSPLSRSFYKMIEICNTLHIIDINHSSNNNHNNNHTNDNNNHNNHNNHNNDSNNNSGNNGNIKTFHLAEGKWWVY